MNENYPVHLLNIPAHWQRCIFLYMAHWHKGVLDHLPEQGVLEEAKEMLHANPVGTGEALLGTVIPEGDLHAVHGTVQENDEVDQAGKQQQIPLPAFSQSSEQIAFSMAGKSVCGCITRLINNLNSTSVTSLCGIS